MADLGSSAGTRAIAAFGLPCGDPPSEIVVRERDEWQALLSDVTAQRLTGLAMAAADAGVLRLSTDQTRALVERQRGAMLHALQLERLLLRLAATFERAGLEMVVLKGPALAHVWYDDPSWRPFGDLDVLVRSRDWSRVGELLAAGGFSGKYPEPRPGFRERFGHTWVHTDGDGLELDVHRILVAGPFGLWMDPNELFERTTTFRLGGRTLRRLDDQATFLHACIHASLGHLPPLMLPVRDVAQVLPRSELDWPDVWKLARRWRLQAVVQYALPIMADTLRIDLPTEAEMIAQLRCSRRERRALQAYTTDRRVRGGKAIASVQAIKGIPAKAAYVRALLFPDPEFLTFSEGGSRLAPLLARWAKPVRWLVRRP